MFLKLKTEEKKSAKPIISVNVLDPIKHLYFQFYVIMIIVIWKKLKIRLNGGEMFISIHNSLLTPTIKMILKLYVFRRV